jgi:hypothetical protein
MSAGFIGRVPVELDPWALHPAAGGSQFDRDDHFAKFCEKFGYLLRQAELHRHHLAGVEHDRLADPRLVGFRKQVEQYRAEVERTVADLLAALPKPEREREKLVDKLLDQARRGR